MITNNVIQRVFRLRYRGQTGTGFLIDIEGQQYFVTAKHVLHATDAQGQLIDPLQAGSNIDIFRDNAWLPLPVVSVAHSADSDVSIFTLRIQIPAHPLPANMSGLVYGQDVFFLGFPYGLSFDVGEVNRNFPMPLVKKGIVSAMFFTEPGQRFFVDGHNNPGFSGGPVVFKVPGENDFKIAGVISGYAPEHRVVNGALEPIENTNSGIITAYSINNAQRLIEEIQARQNELIS